jgi:hypothetical protein
MIEPTDAPVPSGIKQTPADDEISQGFSLQQNKAYQFKRNDELGGIRVAFNTTINPNRYDATFALNSDFTPSQVSCHSYIFCYLYSLLMQFLL